MSQSISPFSPPLRAKITWFNAGATSSYPNILDTTRIASQHACQGRFVPGCRVFHVPRHASSKVATEVAIDEWNEGGAGAAKDQVMVFQYRGVFFAVDHECPHSSYPLSSGSTFDIEDFGVVLSAGIMCSKHDWGFDLHTGKSDRGSYKLSIWEVEQRPSASGGERNGDDGEEVWVRRKGRIG